MASSRVMASSSSANSDLARLPSAFSLTKNVGSLNMDDLLRNIYASPSPSTSKSAEEVWREISACRPAAGEDGAAEEVTLEAFLAKAGSVDEDVRGIGMLAADSALQQQQQLPPEIEAQLFGNGAEGGGGRRRKRGTADPVDKVAMQRQKRMIKNRESAARSRERKQAYTMELEALASKLEDENTELVKYQEEQDRIRLKQLMEKVIPITEKKKPQSRLQRTLSLPLLGDLV